MKYALHCQRTTKTGRVTFVIEWHDNPVSLALAWQQHTQGPWDTMDVYEAPIAWWRQGHLTGDAQLSLCLGEPEAENEDPV
jgi:hypothetical protein